MHGTKWNHVHITDYGATISGKFWLIFSYHIIDCINAESKNSDWLVGPLIVDVGGHTNNRFSYIEFKLDESIDGFQAKRVCPQ